MKVAVFLFSGALLLATPAAAQHGHHDALNVRGARFMGFDQHATTHHFLLSKDGGRIEVTAKDPKDAGSVKQIREHLQHVAEVFARGDFALPGLVHDTKVVPGVDGMKANAAALAFTYEEIDRGAQVKVVGSSPEAIRAVHQFLRFQITDHKTGDPLSPVDRGGRD